MDAIQALKLHAARLRSAEFHVEVRDAQANDNDIVIRGFASTPDVDRFGDIVEVDSFKGTIDAYMTNGVVLLHHDHEVVVGRPTGYDLNAKGFELEARIYGGLHPLDVHEQTKHNVRLGLLKALSIGFRINKDERATGAGAVRRITDLELFEISVVSVPANRSTMFNVVKGLTSGSDSPEDMYLRGLPWSTRAWAREDAGDEGDDDAMARIRMARARLNKVRAAH